MPRSFREARTVNGANLSGPGGRNAPPNRTESKTVRRLPRAGGLALALGGVGLLAAACGGGSASPGVASLGPTTTTIATAIAPAGNSGSPSAQLKYTRCMQTHGVPDFPDPGPGAVAAMRKIDVGAPKFQSAYKACQATLPHGGAITNTPLPPKVLAEALKFTQCMRTHGVANWPEPTSTYYVAPPSGSYQSADLKAAKACQAFIPKGS